VNLFDCDACPAILTSARATNLGHLCQSPNRAAALPGWPSCSTYPVSANSIAVEGRQQRKSEKKRIGPSNVPSGSLPVNFRDARSFLEHQFGSRSNTAKWREFGGLGT